MKKIMRIFVVITISLICLPSYGQTFGLKGGFNLANMLAKDDDYDSSDELKMNPGFHAGATMDFPLTDLLSLETGLLFTTKGMKLDEEFLGMKVTANTNLFYLDVPVTLKAKYNLGSVKIYGAIGPYVGMGLFGNVKGTVEYQGEKETDTEDIRRGSDENEDDLKRLDTGLTFGGGFEVGVIQIGISYDMGLSNISAYTENGATIKNKVLKFSLGYRFGK